MVEAAPDGAASFVAHYKGLSQPKFCYLEKIQ